MDTLVTPTRYTVATQPSTPGLVPLPRLPACDAAVRHTVTVAVIHTDCIGSYTHTVWFLVTRFGLPVETHLTGLLWTHPAPSYYRGLPAFLLPPTVLDALADAFYPAVYRLHAGRAACRLLRSALYHLPATFWVAVRCWLRVYTATRATPTRLITDHVPGATLRLRAIHAHYAVNV